MRVFDRAIVGESSNWREHVLNNLVTFLHTCSFWMGVLFSGYSSSSLQNHRSTVCYVCLTLTWFNLIAEQNKLKRICRKLLLLIYIYIVHMLVTTKQKEGHYWLLQCIARWRWRRQGPAGWRLMKWWGEKKTCAAVHHIPCGANQWPGRQAQGDSGSLWPLGWVESNYHQNK